MIRASLDLEIVEGNISLSWLVQRMKGLTSRKLLMENKGLNKGFWGRHLWGRD